MAPDLFCNSVRAVLGWACDWRAAVPSSARSLRRMIPRQRSEGAVMSDDRGDARGVQAWRVRPAGWIVIAFLFADFLAVADSLWWHWLDASPGAAAWRRLRNFFGIWDVDASSVDVVRLTLASSQASLLVLWACFGRRKWALRWATAAVGIGYCITVLVANAATDQNPTQVELLFFCQAATIVILALGLRIAGWRLSSTASNDSSDGTHPRIQFAMQDLIAGTGIVAALLWLYPNLFLQQTFDELYAAVKFRGVAFWFWDPRARLVWIAASGILSGAVAMLGIWCLLRPGRIWPRLAACCLTSWAMARIAILAHRDFDIYVQQRISVYTEPDRTTPYIAWLCLQSAVLALALVVLRQNGYCLSNRKTLGASPELDAPRSRKFKIWPAFAWGICIVLLATAILFDDAASWLAGDRGLRKAVAVIHSKRIENVSAFCFWRDNVWRHPAGPAVGIRVAGPIDLTTLRDLLEIGSIEGICLEGAVDDDSWREILGRSNLKFLRVDAGEVSGRFTDADLRRLTVLTKLESLEICSPDVSDAGLKYLSELPHLRQLQLDCPRVTLRGGPGGVAAGSPD